MTTSSRVGLYGGAFDPPHLAHRALAEQFIRQAALDRLHICPTANAWHKSRALSDVCHRVRMCQLAFGDLAPVLIDEREIRRGGKTYTVDTLKSLKTQYPQAQLSLLIGQDQHERLHTWHALPEIEQLATIYVAPRATEPTATLQATHLQPGYQLLNWQPVPDSATDIRERSHRGTPIDTLVTPAVAGYIAEHHLYH